MNHPAPEVHEALAEVLAAHDDWFTTDVGGPDVVELSTNCLCGESLDRQDVAVAHRLHLASVLADHFAEAVTEARARELREAADEMHFGVARSAMITERAECHKKQCSCGHPSEDRLLALVGDRFRDALRARADSLAPVTSVESGCTCGGMAACQQCQDRDSLAPEASGAEGDGIECPTSAVTAASHDSAPELALARVIEVVEMYESCGPKQRSTRDVLAAVRTAALAPEAPSEAQA